ncbi:hypothetical protein COT30_04825 [Candidatus Micrarchaeota archaeon CG08_land_8_20_14_0_20_49_17]|nr:MAG: hypothetical protein AUJ13_00100 [Candidatus Micrarchaeota archaeon CG1_02_49_24]PIU09351.1 MAG: hypothetical protein COT30_04825 [Candidatus Micrarchaeota archaeon CG08_land_8_20_14_0_20_49_17]PIZ99011.1 MAG: hypothetical protein COX84_01425 [Candidatus Micrarchaeota archaeon CG_4_10_14_0_2_um_filter_49_7]HII53506.1 hypothetical protein [Candidatus Micrarchaeota archaeon]
MLIRKSIPDGNRAGSMADSIGRRVCFAAKVGWLDFKRSFFGSAHKPFALLLEQMAERALDRGQIPKGIRLLAKKTYGQLLNHHIDLGNTDEAANALRNIAYAEQQVERLEPIINRMHNLLPD